MSPDPIQDYAEQIERSAHDAELLHQLDELAATADAARAAIWQHSHRYGHRYTSAVTGLTLATVQRWRHELPVETTLRATAERRA